MGRSQGHFSADCFSYSNVWPLVLSFLSALGAFFNDSFRRKGFGYNTRKLPRLPSDCTLLTTLQFWLWCVYWITFKIKDLAVRFRVPKFVFRFVLFCFWLQFFTYVITALFQFISGVMESTSASMGKWENDILQLVTKAGQLAFMKIASGCLWDGQTPSRKQNN